MTDKIRASDSHTFEMFEPVELDRQDAMVIAEHFYKTFKDVSYEFDGFEIDNFDALRNYKDKPIKNLVVHGSVGNDYNKSINVTFKPNSVIIYTTSKINEKIAAARQFVRDIVEPRRKPRRLDITQHMNSIIIIAIAFTSPMAIIHREPFYILIFVFLCLGLLLRA